MGTKNILPPDALIKLQQAGVDGAGEAFVANLRFMARMALTWDGQFGSWNNAASGTLANVGGKSNGSFDHPGGDLLAIGWMTLYGSTAVGGFDVKLNVGANSTTMNTFINTLAHHSGRLIIGRWSAVTAGALAVNIQVRTSSGGIVLNTDVDDYTHIVCIPF